MLKLFLSTVVTNRLKGFEPRLTDVNLVEKRKHAILRVFYLCIISWLGLSLTLGTP